MLRINGEEANEAIGQTIVEYLVAKGYRREVVAVELNGAIIPRSSFDELRFADGDSAEIVRFVGGG